MGLLWAFWEETGGFSKDCNCQRGLFWMLVGCGSDVAGLGLWSVVRLFRFVRGGPEG